MGLQEIVNLQITLKSSAPTKAGFGRPMILTPQQKFAGRTKLYTTADALLLDGYTTSDQEYKIATAIKSQNPCPKDFKLGRCALPPTQIVELTPNNLTALKVWSGKVNGVAWTFTADGTPTLAELCTGIAAAIDPLADVAAVSSGGTKVVCTVTAGKVLQFTDMSPDLRVAETTTDPGIATDLAAIFAADTDWFGLLLSSNSKAEILAAAAWIETKRRMLVYNTADYAVKDGASTTDVMYLLKASSYFNTGGFYHQDVGSTMAAAIMAQRLTALPGSDTWAHKKVTGPISSSGPAYDGVQYLTAAEEVNVQAKNGNTYTTIAGNGNTYPGKVASGDYFDITRYIHFLFARLQEKVIFMFQSAEKIPFTDAGADKIKGGIETVLGAHTKEPYNALVPGSTFVQVPLVADVDASDKAARKLPNVTFNAKLSGAIHATDISGTVSTT